MTTLLNTNDQATLSRTVRMNRALTYRVIVTYMLSAFEHTDALEIPAACPETARIKAINSIKSLFRDCAIIDSDVKS